MSRVEFEDVKRANLFVPGTDLCPGCGANLVFRYAINTLGKNTVSIFAAGCGAMLGRRAITPGMMSLLENPAAPACGLKAGLDIKGKEMNVLCIIGDGGTDMGIGGVAAAAERGDPIIYICYDNEAYMNTGIQRSGRTSYGAWTTFTPGGKERPPKDIPRMIADAGAAYVATASIAYINDYIKKVKKAEEVTKNDEGMAYIHVQSPCPTGWRYPTNLTVKVAKHAVQSGLWNLYEIYKGKLRFTVKMKERIPVGEYVKLQGRFGHLKDEQIELLQKYADEKYRELELMESKE